MSVMEAPANLATLQVIFQRTRLGLSFGRANVSLEAGRILK